MAALLEQDSHRGNQLAKASFYLGKGPCQKVSACLLQTGGPVYEQHGHALGIKRTREIYHTKLSGNKTILFMS